MSKKISLWILICAVLFTALITFQITKTLTEKSDKKELYDTVKENTAGDSEAVKKVKEVEKIVDSYYYYDVDKDHTSDVLPWAYISSLGNQFSRYMTAEEYEEHTSEANAEMHGIGITVVVTDDGSALEVMTVSEGAPADKAGIEIGDLIYKVGDKEVSELGYEAAVSALRGKSGTDAVFSVLREKDGEQTSLDFSVTREDISTVSVTLNILDSGVAVMRISKFDLKTPEQFDGAIEKIKAAGIDKIVFDLRNNPGGQLESITKILDELLPEGPIIRTVDRDGNEERIDSDENELGFSYAIVVNSDTASAAELFTSAMRDYDKAKIFGETTYGKGSMQITVPLSDGSAVIITHKLYSPPFSANYDGVGIVPDVEIGIDEEYSRISIYRLTLEQDAPLRAAVGSLLG